MRTTVVFEMVNLAGTTASHLSGSPPASADLAHHRTQDDRLLPLADVGEQAWTTLAGRIVEPNAYYLPGWARAVSAFARGRSGGKALTAWSRHGAHRLIGLMPVKSLWRAYRIPIPGFASFDPYGALGTPLFDRECASEAAARLIEIARAAGARALVLRDLPLDGPAAQAITHVLDWRRQRMLVIQSHERAALDATHDAEALLREGLGAKRLKGLRRQRARLAERGEVTFAVARTSAEIAKALPVFLALEASGWKGARGTALARHAGDGEFIRQAMAALAIEGHCEIVTLACGGKPIASGIVLRQRGRAFFFKIGIDETFAKFSPGVQLTLDLTRHLCADPAIALADSTAIPNHPMIGPIWRKRIRIGDVVIPLRAGSIAAPLVYATLRARHLARIGLKHAARFIRHLGKATNYL